MLSLTPRKSFQLPSLEWILNRRFFYCLCVNSLIYALGLWLLTGGGQYEFLDASLFSYLIKNFIFNGLLLFCVFYILFFIPFSLYIEWAICILYFVIGVVDIFLSFTFQAQLNNAFFMIFLSTNFIEAQEFIQFYALSPKVITAILVFVIFSILFFILTSLRKIHLFIPTQLNRKITLIILAASFSIVGYKLYTASQITILQIYINEKNAVSRWYNTILSCIVEQRSFLQQYTNLSQQMSENLAKKQNTEIRSSTPTLPIIVFIIGESTQRNLMSLYGYRLPTTPRLESLQKENHLIVFQDFVSPFPSTDRSLQRVLTFSHHENAQTPWYMQQNLIDVLNLAGYKTHWLSNQDVISIYGNSPEIIAQRAQFTKFTIMGDSLVAGRPTDGILIPMLNEIRQDSQSTQPMFYAIHLMGAHAGYNGRYPKNFEHFSAQDLQSHQLDSLQGQKLSKTQLLTKIQYLNAIRYNDYVVSEMMKQFENEDAIVFYLSDHGEEVYDFRDFSGHSDGNISRFMVEIPAMVYVSDVFKQNHPDVVQKLQNAINKPFMTDDFIHAFLDIAGIQSEDFDITRSVFSPLFNNKRDRISGGKDYDKELKTQALRP